MGWEAAQDTGQDLGWDIMGHGVGHGVGTGWGVWQTQGGTRNGTHGGTWDMALGPRMGWDTWWDNGGMGWDTGRDVDWIQDRTHGVARDEARGRKGTRRGAWDGNPGCDTVRAQRCAPRPPTHVCPHGPVPQAAPRTPAASRPASSSPE